MRYTIKIILCCIPLCFVQYCFAQRPGIAPITAKTACAKAVEYAVQQGYTDAKVTMAVALQVYSLDTMLVQSVIDDTNKEWLEWNGKDYTWGIDLLTSKVSGDSLIIVDVFADSATKPLRCKLQKYSRKELDSYDSIPVGDKWIDSDSLGKLPRLCKEQYLRDAPLFAKRGSWVTIYLYMYANVPIWVMYEPFETSTSFYANTGEVRTKGTTLVTDNTYNSKAILTPNPITEGFTISENIQARSVQMYSAIGAMVHEWNTVGEMRYCTTQHVPQGMYTVRIQCEDGSIITTRVVVSR